MAIAGAAQARWTSQHVLTRERGHYFGVGTLLQTREGRKGGYGETVGARELVHRGAHRMLEETMI